MWFPWEMSMKITVLKNYFVKRADEASLTLSTPNTHISIDNGAGVAMLTVRQVPNSVRRTGNRRRDFSASNSAGIGVFYIYMYSTVAGPFAQEQRLQFTRLTTYSMLAYRLIFAY